MTQLGKLQRQISRAFIAKPGAQLTTNQLVAWCYPRLKKPVLHKHRFAVRRAAERFAVVVGRLHPGGFIWQAKAEMPSADTGKLPNKIK